MVSLKYLPMGAAHGGDLSVPPDLSLRGHKPHPMRGQDRGKSLRPPVAGNRWPPTGLWNWEEALKTWPVQVKKYLVNDVLIAAWNF